MSTRSISHRGWSQRSTCRKSCKKSSCCNQRSRESRVRRNGKEECYSRGWCSYPLGKLSCNRGKAWYRKITHLFRYQTLQLCDQTRALPVTNCRRDSCSSVRREGIFEARCKAWILADSAGWIKSTSDDLQHAICRWWFTRLLFGIKSAQEVFQKYLSTVWWPRRCGYWYWWYTHLEI